MKSLLVVLLACLLISLFPNPLVANDPEPLYDTSGDKVIIGTQYYLVAASSKDGGGLSTSNPSCPRDIYLESSATSLGQPIVFSLANYTGKIGTVVYESSDLNMHFNTQLCRLLQNEWNVGQYDESVGSWIIFTRGVIPTCWFKFVKVCNDNVYVVLFNPSSCGLERIIPENYVGVISKSDRRLALINYPPLRLKIVKVSDVNRHQIKQAII